MTETEVKKGGLTLRILTPAGIAAEMTCIGVTMPLSDDGNGKGGGSIGVRKGHINAVMALSGGELRADGMRVKISAGLACVENDVVTVMTENASTIKDDTE